MQNTDQGQGHAFSLPNPSVQHSRQETLIKIINDTLNLEKSLFIVKVKLTARKKGYLWFSWTFYYAQYEHP